MPEATPSVRIWLGAGLTTGAIVYGSLFPFEFRVPVSGVGILTNLLHSIRDRPHRGDVLANIALYAPLGYFVRLGLPGCRDRTGLLLCSLIGLLLSLCLESIQSYVPGRVSAVSDVCLNTFGALLGALAARLIGGRLPLPILSRARANPVPALLLLCWIGCRLFPYVPTIDLHKYWNALKPIVLTPSLDGLDLLRQAVLWLTAFALIESILGGRSRAIAPLFAAAVLSAEVLIVGIVVHLADPTAAALAYAIWLILLRLARPLQMAAISAMLAATIVALRLEPYTFLEQAHPFGWVPFLGMMHGSLRADVLALVQKIVLYGGLVYLLGEAIGRLPAVLLVAALLLATGWAETHLPGRSGGLTDTVIALLAALVFAALRLPSPEPAGARLDLPNGA